MQEGDVVVITGKVSTKIRDLGNSLLLGTIWVITKDKEVIVLLPDGNLFVGPMYLIALAREQIL